MTRVTKHAEKRMKERMNLNKSAKQKKADYVFENGICTNEASGSLRKYFDWLFLHDPAGQIRIYGREVFIFLNDGTLKTVLPLLHRYNAAVDKILKNKKRLA